MFNEFWASPGITIHSLVILLMHFKACISERAIKGGSCLRGKMSAFAGPIKI